MLKADRPVGHDADRSSIDLREAMRHRHRRFLVAARDQLRLRVAAVVDDRLVERTEARPRIRADVLEAKRLHDVDHAVGAAAIGRQRLSGWLLDRRLSVSGRRFAESRTANRDSGSVLQERPSIEMLCQWLPGLAGVAAGPNVIFAPAPGK